MSELGGVFSRSSLPRWTIPMVAVNFRLWNAKMGIAVVWPEAAQRVRFKERFKDGARMLLSHDLDFHDQHTHFPFQFLVYSSLDCLLSFSLIH